MNLLKWVLLEFKISTFLDSHLILWKALLNLIHLIPVQITLNLDHFHSKLEKMALSNLQMLLQHQTVCRTSSDLNLSNKSNVDSNFIFDTNETIFSLLFHKLNKPNVVPCRIIHQINRIFEIVNGKYCILDIFVSVFGCYHSASMSISFSSSLLQLSLSRLLSHWSGVSSSSLISVFDVLLLSNFVSNLECRHFIRRFWNQTFTFVERKMYD